MLIMCRRAEYWMFSAICRPSFSFESQFEVASPALLFTSFRSAADPA